MRAEQLPRAWWVSALALAVVAGTPSSAEGQITVPIAIPAGTKTFNYLIPPNVQLPPPPPPPQSSNPLGLTPGFYSINLGGCFGENSSKMCSGGFLTHAAPTGSTVGVPVAFNPAASVGESFGSFFGGSAADDSPAVPTSNTMPGWSLFAMNLGGGQQALSVADFTTTIEMPRSQQFPGNWLLPDWRNHSFSRSEDYNELRVAYPFIVDVSKNPPFQRLLSLELRGEPQGKVSWETSFITGSSISWTTGWGAVKSGDTSFDFLAPAPMTKIEKLDRLLSSISRHLLIEEPKEARQLWLGFNPLGIVAHADWKQIARAIEQELPDLRAGKESNILNSDGTFTLPMRTNLHAFLLPEPTSVPEPSTLALLGLGITLLGLSRRRR